MLLRIRPEVWPFLVIAGLMGLLFVLLLGRFSCVRWWCAISLGVIFLLVTGGYFLWFFRNPERTPPTDPLVVVAAADGVLADITTLTPDAFDNISMLSGLEPQDITAFKEGEVIRISIFLSLFDVHVNRAPVAGESCFLGYFPGKHLFTFDPKSSDVNQHNSILIRNAHTSCLINQIVGPVCRRVVYWLDHDAPVAVSLGQPFGMMKFGSRLDMYFPASEIQITVDEGTRLRAGETVIGRYH